MGTSSFNQKNGIIHNLRGGKHPQPGLRLSPKTPGPGDGKDKNIRNNNIDKPITPEKLMWSSKNGHQLTRFIHKFIRCLPDPYSYAEIGQRPKKFCRERKR